MAGDSGRAHGKALKKILHIGEGMSEFIRANSYAPENYLEGFVLESSDENNAVFCNPSCSVQKARVQKGLSEYPCRDAALSYLQNFANQIDPRITVECIVAPPGLHTETCYCKWQFTVNEGA